MSTITQDGGTLMPTMSEIVPVESRTLPDHVYQRLRHAIHVGHLKPGQRLNDGELAKALQVSRTTVREALRMLESRGLVEIRHRRGAFVAELTPDELRAAAARQDYEGIVDLDLRFHLGICHLARSKRLLETWRSMETMLRAFLLLKYALYDDSALIAGSHQPILDALRERDAERAA